MAAATGQTSSEPRQRAAANVAGMSGETTRLQAFAQMLKIESEARRARSAAELDALAVNDGQRLLRSRQAFVVEHGRRGCRVAAASSLTVMDATSPMIDWVIAIVRRLGKEKELAQQTEFSLPGYAPADDELTRQYPFRDVLWQPLWSPTGRSCVGVLYFRHAPFNEAERSIAARLAETFGHARALLAATGVRVSSTRPRWLVTVSAALLVAVVGAIPVPIAVLAPLEVSPRDADVVAMPVDGIVDKVLVRPNATVSAGTPLIRIQDTVLRNRAEIAAREVEVAAARLEKATSLAFSDMRGREELGIARAELALRRAEHAYARELLDQTLVKAERAGIVVFSDPRELEGRPLTTGDRLMLVAREGDVELKISLPVADSIVLKRGLPVKGFLDSNPLDPVGARITSIDRHVRVDETQVASFRVTARLVDEAARLTIGARGTAQIQGERAPLALYLFRRPLTYVRQWIGW
ncbi:MAG: HlyD family efflux transporter periplasmic adaptor subunit [Gammaproteobacteria bacterium]